MQICLNFIDSIKGSDIMVDFKETCFNYSEGDKTATFQISASREEQDADDDFLQQLAANTSLYAKGGPQSWHERHCA